MILSMLAENAVKPECLKACELINEAFRGRGRQRNQVRRESVGH
jgi:hypothetical protein